MKIRHTPCYNCLERKENCHSTCKEYQEYDKYRKKISEKRQEYNSRKYE